MKITIESEGTIATVEDKSVVDIYEAMRLCKQVLFAVGYQQKSWDMAVVSAYYETGADSAFEDTCATNDYLNESDDEQDGED